MLMIQEIPRHLADPLTQYGFNVTKCLAKDIEALEQALANPVVQRTYIKKFLIWIFFSF